MGGGAPVLVITIHRLMFYTDGDGGVDGVGGGSISYYHSPANVLHTSGAGGWSPTATSAQVITIHQLMFPTDGDGGVDGVGGGAVLVITIHWLIFHTHWGQGDGGGGHQQPRQHKLLPFTG